MTFRVSVVHTTVALDTLVMVATWTNPIDDGKGPPDSIRITFSPGMVPDSTVVYRAPFPVRREWRVAIPLSAYGVPPQPGNGWSVTAWATAYRRKVNAPPLRSNVVTVNLTDIPPANVTDFGLTVVKVP